MSGGQPPRGQERGPFSFPLRNLMQHSQENFCREETEDGTFVYGRFLAGKLRATLGGTFLLEDIAKVN